MKSQEYDVMNNRCDESTGFGLELIIDESEVMMMSVREADEENSQ